MHLQMKLSHFVAKVHTHYSLIKATRSGPPGANNGPFKAKPSSHHTCAQHPVVDPTYLPLSHPFGALTLTINLIIIRSDVTRHNVLYIQVLMVIGPDHRVERVLLIHLQNNSSNFWSQAPKKCGR